MKTKTIIVILVIAFTLASCSPAPLVTGTPTLPPTQQTVIPTSITHLTPIPSPTFTPTLPPTTTPYPTSTPYPTASVVKANAVAFIEKESENNLSLWVANIDGSGERKIAGDIGKWSDTTNYFLRWSPNGKWISYISNGEMWLVSPDGSARRKVLPASDKSKQLISYAWAPDDSQIAYTQVSLHDSKFDSESVRILNLMTGETYDVSTHQKPQPYGIVVKWSPNGQFLAFNKDSSFVVFDVVDRKIEKEILPDNPGICSTSDNNIGPVWSPNGKWFFHEHSAAAHYTSFYICISKLDGSTYRVELDGTILSDIVWDKTGNFLYFVVGRVITLGDSNLNRNPRLQRYDVRTQKLEQLLTLREAAGWSISISPDGHTLETRMEVSNIQQSYILMDLESLSITKEFNSKFICVWSADNENFIYISQSSGYPVFHRINIQTGETNIFSGKHIIASWVISPIVTTP